MRTSDRRLSNLGKIVFRPLGRSFMSELSRAIAVHGDSRLTIATRLQINARTLERMFSPTDIQCLRLDLALDMLVRDDVLSTGAREHMRRWLLRELDLVAVDAARSHPSTAPVEGQVVEIFAAGGDVAQAVTRSAAPDSPGGSRRTLPEVRELLARVRRQREEVTELEATLELEERRLFAHGERA